MNGISVVARFDCLADARHATHALAAAGFRSTRLRGDDDHPVDVEPAGRAVLSAFAAACACGFTGVLIGLAAGGFTPIGWADGLSIPVLTGAGGAASGAVIAVLGHLSARRNADSHAVPTLLLIDAHPDDVDAIRRMLRACNVAGVRIGGPALEKETGTEPASRRELA